MFGQLRIPSQFLVTRDAAATAANILSNETLFRLGPTLALISVAFHIAWVVLFYELFKPVNRTPSLLAAFVGLIAIALQAVSAIFQNAPLTILHGGEFSSAFTAEQFQVLAYLSLQLQDRRLTCIWSSSELVPADWLPHFQIRLHTPAGGSAGDVGGRRLPDPAVADARQCIAPILSVFRRRRIGPAAVVAGEGRGL